MSKIKVAITTGDVDGIGLEVAAKALSTMSSIKNVQFLLWRSHDANKKYLRLIDESWRRTTLGTLEEAFRHPNSRLIDIASHEPPARWVEESAQACMEKDIHAMATGPLSKTGIMKSGLNDLGHTDILSRISGAKNVNMAFLGNSFNVVLATGHWPLRNVPSKLTFEKLSSALLNANKLRKDLTKAQRMLPIGILGLNPHAGEEGLIGTEEGRLFPMLRAFAKTHKIPIVGPLVPDAAFLPTQWKKHSLYLALYHDQGLIPFKMIHGQDSGAHITLGTPIIRTSVDHGTAKDIFGKNKANPNSMIDAIHWAIKLARHSPS